LGDAAAVPGGASASPESWRVSSGTAAVLGLRPAVLDAAPTTAYLMLGARCARGCAFCAQARDSRADESALSRVHWPAFPRDEVARAVASACSAGQIARACFQITDGPQAVPATAEAVRRLAGESQVPICACLVPRSLEDVRRVLAAGAERVTIALDAATPQIYRRVKTGSWRRTLGLLEEAAHAFPGHIGTHLIAGLGETERYLVLRLADLAALGVRVALFAFTPVGGTRMASCPPPEMASYRRLQSAQWLLPRGLVAVEAMRWDDAGRLVSLGLSAEPLRALLRDGEAFRTSGCPGCNRPYYNERPGGPLYNYPRPLTADEADREIATLLATLAL